MLLPAELTAATKVQTTVTGIGDTKGDAERAAHAVAVRISVSYRRISRTTTRSGSNWVCTMVIEYTPR